MRKITAIIIHHSLSMWGSAEVIRHWHCDPRPQGNGWKIAGYHFVIQNGYPIYNSWHNKQYKGSQVEFLVPIEQVSNGCKYANKNSINVCLIGNFDTESPGNVQYSEAIDLIARLLKKYNLTVADVYGHGEMMKKIGKEGYVKSCPGKLFDMDHFRRAVKVWM